MLDPGSRPGVLAVDSAAGADASLVAEAAARGREPDTDDVLVHAWVSRGDRAAFAALVGRHQAFVFRLALSVLGPGGEADAQDVAQDVFIRLAGSAQAFRGDSAFRTWLRRLALNLALDRRRLARWRKPHVDAAVLEERAATDPEGDPFSSAEAAERKRVLGQCLDALAPVVRTVLHLHYWVDLSVDEIATTLQVPPGTVKSHLFRGRKLLYHAMQAKGLSHE